MVLAGIFPKITRVHNMRKYALGQANRARGGGGGGKHTLSRHFKYYNKVDTAHDPSHFTKLK